MKISEKPESEYTTDDWWEMLRGYRLDGNPNRVYWEEPMGSYSLDLNDPEDLKTWRRLYGGEPMEGWGADLDTPRGSKPPTIDQRDRLQALLSRFVMVGDEQRTDQAFVKEVMKRWQQHLSAPILDPSE